jgi:hypothetical protein
MDVPDGCAMHGFITLEMRPDSLCPRLWHARLRIGLRRVAGMDQHVSLITRRRVLIFRRAVFAQSSSANSACAVFEPSKMITVSNDSYTVLSLTFTVDIRNVVGLILSAIQIGWVYITSVLFTGVGKPRCDGW